MTTIRRRVGDDDVVLDTATDRAWVVSRRGALTAAGLAAGLTVVTATPALAACSAPVTPMGTGNDLVTAFYALTVENGLPTNSYPGVTSQGWTFQHSEDPSSWSTYFGSDYSKADRTFRTPSATTPGPATTLFGYEAPGETPGVLHLAGSGGGMAAALFQTRQPTATPLQIDLDVKNDGLVPVLLRIYEPFVADFTAVLQPNEHLVTTVSRCTNNTDELIVAAGAAPGELGVGRLTVTALRVRQPATTPQI